MSAQALGTPSFRLHCRRIAHRQDLSFVTLRPGSHAIAEHWNVPHDPSSCWHQGKLFGRALFAELAALASANPGEAALAITGALNSPAWRTGGWGIEQGFTEALAEFALLGLQTLALEVRHAA